MREQPTLDHVGVRAPEPPEPPPPPPKPGPRHPEAAGQVEQNTEAHQNCDQSDGLENIKLTLFCVFSFCVFCSD